MTHYLDAKEVENSVVDAMSIILSKEFREKQVFVFKQKDANFYMNTYGL